MGSRLRSLSRSPPDVGSSIILAWLLAACSAGVVKGSLPADSDVADQDEQDGAESPQQPPDEDLDAPVECGPSDGVCPPSCSPVLDLDCGPIPTCGDGAVTNTCRCGAALVNDGYCCEGEAQTAECFSCATAQGLSHAYFVSPTGRSENPGTVDAPFAAIPQAVAVVAPGDTIWLRGGLYNLTEITSITGPDGTSAQPIRLWGCPGEEVILDLSNVVPSTSWSSGIQIRGVDYWHVKGLEIRNLPQVSTGGLTPAVRIDNSNHNTFERLDIHHHGGPGIHLSGNSTGNLFLNCDFHHNFDPLTASAGGVAGGNADGIGIESIPDAALNTIKGCRSWRNSDDGYDLWANEGVLLFEDSWAFENGYVLDTQDTAGDGNGFKLGKTDENSDGRFHRVLRHCLAANNRMRGFDQNNARSLTAAYNNTAYHNGSNGFDFAYDFGIVNVFKNNVALANGWSWGATDGAPASLAPGTYERYNSWNEGWSVNESDFVSLDTSCMTAPRKSNGALPDCPVAALAATSLLVDAGDDVCLPYCGSTPDLGARESQLATESCQAEACSEISIVTIGDSTVAAYDVAATTERGWGQMLAGVLHAAVVDDRAKGGESSKSFILEGRWQTVLDETTPDIVLIQFGHNDLLTKPEDHRTDPGVPLDDSNYYFRNNISRYVRETRDTLHALPVLVTPMERRNFDADGKINRLNEPYAIAMRAVAQELAVDLIDLNAMSIAVYEQLYEQVGPDAGIELHFDDGTVGRDRTHFCAIGARLYADEVARHLPAPFTRYAVGD